MSYIHKHAWGHCWIFSIGSWWNRWRPFYYGSHIVDHPDKTTHAGQLGKKHIVLWVTFLRLDVIWQGAEGGKHVAV